MLCIERLFGLACQGNEGSVHPFTLHTAMRRTVPSWLAGWHTLKDQQSNHLALARCWLRHGWSQTREVVERRVLDIAFNTTSLGEWEPALSAAIQVSISIICNQIRCSAALHTHHII